MAKKKVVDENILSAFLSMSDTKPSKRKAGKTSKRSEKKKVKLTIYVTEKCDKEIEELKLALRKKEGRRITKSEVVERAISCLKGKI